ncbi:MAG TPA: helix-turn-helix domain-containing protein [Granulicella sp.]
MAPPIQLTPQQIQRITRALADPNRFEMLRKIHAHPSLSCGNTCSDMTVSPATASHHIRELEMADLITVTREGRYRILEPRHDVWRAYLAELRKF